MRKAHELADEHEDVATASLLEIFIDEAEKRCWFLFEASRQAERPATEPPLRGTGRAGPARGLAGARSGQLAASFVWSASSAPLVDPR